jgi:hypothetical protein
MLIQRRRRDADAIRDGSEGQRLRAVLVYDGERRVDNGVPVEADPRHVYDP